MRPPPLANEKEQGVFQPCSYRIVFVIQFTKLVFNVIAFILSSAVGMCGLFLGEADIFLGGLVFVLLAIWSASIILKFFEEREQIAAQHKRRMERYNHDKEVYQHWLEDSKNEEAEIEQKYQDALVKYTYELQKYEEKRENTNEKHQLALELLENARDALYGENIIFPKYRNLIAITAINEYLISGRCYSLEGPDGAYNLYEMELRQNIVIDKLLSIESNLEQIRTNQFSLYEELAKSNDLVNNIIHEIRELQKDTKLIAYFAKVTAIAETSPKTYYID